MKRFLNWFRKDPYIHSFVLFLSVPIIIFFVIAGIFIYSFLSMFHPDYLEFGPKVALYQAQDCADISKEYPETSDCLLLDFYMESMWKNSPKSLNKVVQGAANAQEYDKNLPIIKQIFSSLINPKPLPALQNYPKKGSQWNCSQKGRIIEDTTKELVTPSQYKCWPK
jgi:hypothetical protein